MRRPLLQALALVLVVVAVFGWGGCAHQAVAPAPTALPAAPGTAVPPATAPADAGLPLVGPPQPPPPPRWTPPALPATAKPLTAPEGEKIVLVLGADDRPGAPGRSDSMILAAVDTQRSSVRLLSLPRDAWAYLPDRGVWDKWNAAYAYGGEALAKRTIERMLGIRIDSTLVINFQGFARIVDAVGGVDVVVDHDLNYDDPWDKPPLHIHLKAGAQHLDGEQALQFARFRADSQNDWGRIKRQQQLANALLKAVLQPKVLPRLPALIPALNSAYRTDIALTDRLRYAALAAQLKGGSIPSDTIGGEDRLVPTVLSDGTSVDVWYTFLDLQAARQKAAWLVLGQTPAPQAFQDEAKRLAMVYGQATPPAQ